MKFAESCRNPQKPVDYLNGIKTYTNERLNLQLCRKRNKKCFEKEFIVMEKRTKVLILF